jgi:hypothetical protein
MVDDNPMGFGPDLDWVPCTHWDPKRSSDASRLEVVPLSTARAFYVGRLESAREYEEFNTDTPLNRMLRAASRSVGASELLSWTDRRRALSSLARMPNVTELQAGDLRAQPGRTLEAEDHAAG